MPAGLQFSNLNRYRRYPFADDSDVRATMSAYMPYEDDDDIRYTSTVVASFLVPDSFMRMFRAVVVHSGKQSVHGIKLIGFGTQPNNYLAFALYDSNGDAVDFECKDGKFSGALKVDVATDGVTAVQCADFNFAHCISLCFDVHFSDLPQDIFGDPMPPQDPEGKLHPFCSCSIPMASGTLLSLDSPHVMSVMDDSGNAARDVDVIKLQAGRNVKFDIMSGSNSVIVSPLKGAGKGRPCGMSGLSTAFSSLDLRSLNGVKADPSGNIGLAGGRGLNVEGLPGTGIVNVYGNVEAESMKGCAAS